MADYQKMYSILCGALSDAMDQLENIPLALPARQTLHKALLRAEEEYLQAPYPHKPEEGSKVIEFKSDEDPLVMTN